MSAIAGVIFDVDGTLVDSVDLHARAWQEALGHFGYEVPREVVRAQIGKGGDKLVAEFVPTAELADIEERLTSYRADLFRRRYLPEVRGFPGVRALFERLRADGKRLALASSAKSDELDEYARRANIEDLLDARVSSDDAARSKPDPDIFQAALAEIGCAVEHAVVVGDSPWDAIAARRAGLSAVGVRCGGFLEPALLEAGFVTLYDDPVDVLRAYEQSGDAALRRRSR